MTNTRQKSQEIEAKFLVRLPGKIGKILDSLVRQGYIFSERSVATHLDRYFDTRDWSLLTAGWACRSRTRGATSRLMLKSLGRQEGSVFERDEVEQPLAGQMLTELTRGKECSELFTVESRRTVFDVSVPGASDASIEFDLDRSRIESEKHYHKAMGRMEFVELEFEGHSDEVEQLAGILRNEPLLIPSQMSKFERGIQAGGYTVQLGYRFAKDPRPTVDSPVLDLVYWYLGQQFDAMRYQYPRAWEGLDPEGVHKMRVATRRLRAVLRAFGKLLPAEARDSLEPEVKWFARVLGEVRDADVGEMSIGQYESALDDLPAAVLKSYISRLQRTTLQAHARLIDVLAGPRYAALCESLGTSIDSGLHEHHGDSMRVKDCEDRYVGKELSKTLQRARKVKRKSSERRLHRLRIRAKRLRYVLEFFATVNPEKWAPTIAALEVFQDVIGEHQDSVTAIERLSDYQAIAEDGDEAAAIEQLINFEESRKRVRRAAAWEEWRKFRETLQDQVAN